MRETTGSSPRHRRRALLIDLDNITISHGERRSAEDVRSRLNRIIAASGPVDYKVAISPACSMAPYTAVLAELHLPARTCLVGIDSADRELCLDGLNLVERGFVELMVASGDHFFSCLAGIAPLTIVLPADQKVAKQLRLTGQILLV